MQLFPKAIFGRGFDLNKDDKIRSHNEAGLMLTPEQRNDAYGIIYANRLEGLEESSDVIIDD